MKRIFLVLSSLILSVPVIAAPEAHRIIRGTITNAIPIDALIVENRGTFTNIFTSEFPYEMSNVRYFTNAPGRVMQGSTGFRFETILGPEAQTTLPRQPMASFHNANGAVISGTDNGATFFGFANGLFLGTSAGTASYVQVKSTNIVNSGTLSVGTVGLMQLKGKNVDLSQGALIAGPAGNSDTNFFLNDFFSGSVRRGFFIGNSYVNAFGVEDLYWGAGPEADISLPNLLGRLNPPNVFSLDHNVQFRPGPLGTVGFGNLILPLTFPADFAAFANINQVGTNKAIQLVFVKTNFADTNISFEVRFGFSSVAPNPPFNPFGQSAFVEFGVPEFDPISGQTITNAVYLIDSSAEQQSLVLLTNALSPNSLARPSSYEITTATPFEWAFAQPPNTPYDPLLVFPGVPGTYKDRVVDGFYSGYGAQVGRNPERASGVTANTNLLGFGNFFGEEFLFFPDPTNQPGRIDIEADTLNLSQARIRAEGILDIKAKHLTGSGAFDVSAGIINADLGTTNGSMIVSNVFPTHFKRVRGDLYAWSAIWSNTETNDLETNAVSFSVLILDHDLKADFKPTIRGLTLRSTNLVVKDDLTVNRNARFVAENLTFGGEMADGSTNVITLIEDAVDFGPANLVGVKNFLNETNSIFQGADELTIGFDDPEGFESIINRGMISATAPYFKAARFINSGTILANNPGSIVIQAGTADLSGGTNLSDGSIEISAGDVFAVNSTIVAGTTGPLGEPGFGKLLLNVTNRLTDFGPGANNIWQVSDGFEMSRKPSQGDLLGTEIHTTATGFNVVKHVWAGQDVGPGADGYFDNAAIGHLILDIQSPNSTLHFSGPDLNGSYALYVENLDVNVGPSIDIDANLNSLLQIDGNFRIYYKNSNAGAKLTDAFTNIIQVESTIFDTALAPLSVSANGFGIITPNLNGKNLKIGDSYQVKARAGRGQVFKNWSGGTNSHSSSLTFQMRRHLALQANFVANPFDDSNNPLPGNYNGLFSETNGVQHESSGFFNLKLTKKGSFTGKILSGKSYPFRGAFDAFGHAQIAVHRPRRPDLTLELQLDMSHQSGQLTGTVLADGWIANLVADRAMAATAVEEGKYTMVIPGGVSPGPAGDGFGTVTVNGKGGLQLKGTLADGTRIQQRVNVSKDGRWPFYTALYRANGSMLSWITFTNDIFLGDLTWFKKAVPGLNYQNGFTNETSVIGSRYTASEPVLGITSGTVTLSGGNLSGSLPNEFTLSSDNLVTTTGTNQLSIRISLPTGSFNGSFVHPDTQKRITIKGVVLQQQNNARGFFLDSDKSSGAVILENN